MADIFISYARADRAKIEKLAGTLANSGYDVWWDREIAGGSEFSAVIERELIAAKAVVVAWSENSLGSHWVRDEADFARSSEKLLPISLDASLPPLGFRQIHAIGFDKWNGDSSHSAFVELLRSLGATEVRSLAENLDAPPSSQSASIAVLPFANMSSDPEQDYFSDGMAEEILNALVKVPDLLVAGRTSSFAFKGKSIDIREIGKALNVDHVLEGSVRKQGERVRITAQLIRASDGFHLWSERYDGSLENVFDLQDEISQAIVDELKTLLGKSESTRLAEKLTESQEAYDLFLRARGRVNKVWGDDTLVSAIELLEKAVAIDPEFVSAWELLARARIFLPQFTTTGDDTAHFKAGGEAARQALKIDPNSHIAKYLLAHSEWDGTNFATYYEENDEAVQLGQDDELIFVKGYHQLVLGRLSAATPNFVSALQRDPLAGRTAFNLAHCYLGLSRFDEAQAMFARSIENGFFGALFGLARMKADLESPDDAINFILGHYDAMGENFGSQIRSREQWQLLARALYARDPVAQDMVEAFVLNLHETGSQPINYVILNSVICERSAETFFKLYLAHKSPANTICIAYEFWQPFPEARKFRQHPGFKDFAEEIGLVEAWQKYGWPELARPDPGTDGSNGAWTID